MFSIIRSIYVTTINIISVKGFDREKGVLTDEFGGLT